MPRIFRAFRARFQPAPASDRGAPARALPARPTARAGCDDRRARAGRSALPLVLALAACADRGPAPQRAVGTGAALVVPAGLAPARTYSGFEDERGRVTLRVSELRQPMPEAARVAATDLSARLGPALRSQEGLVLGGRPACLLRVDPTAAEAPYSDWQLMVFGEHDTLDVRGRFPRDEEARWAEPLRRALLTIDWRPAPHADVFEGPGFRLRPPPDYEHTTSAQGVYGFAARPAAGRPAAFLDPSLTVALQAGEVAPEELEAAAARLLEGRPGTADWQVIQSTGLQLAGVPARELLARARLAREGEPFFFVGVLLSDGGVVWWLHGEAHADLETVELPKLRASLMSFERVRPPDGVAR